MSLLVRFLHAASADVRVDLRRCQTLVAEQLLNAAQVRTSIEQVCRKTVPQRVRCRLAVQAGQHQILVQHAPDAARRQTFPELIQKQRITIFVLRVGLSHLHPVFERFHGIAAKRCDTHHDPSFRHPD